MSVFFPGMEMPKNCEECPVVCRIGVDGFGFHSDKRADDCPLVEIPTPHGRLIDADKAVKRFRGAQKTQKDDSKSSGWICHGLEIAIDIISSTDFPTIIEAEGGGDDG